MAITVVGSVAFDTVETPAGRRERCLAGAATYFSLSASFFTDVRVIAVVGDDFGPEQQAVFDARNVDTTGIQHRPGNQFPPGVCPRILQTIEPNFDDIYSIHHRPHCGEKTV